MPAIPSPASSRAGKGTGKLDPVRAPDAEQGHIGTSPPGSSAPRRSPGRPSSSSKLEEKIRRFYMMIGTIGKPFGRWIPAMVPISENLKIFADDAAEAWIELADEDPKIKKTLENMTAASTWGNVIGIHFAIFASAVPSGVMQDAIPDDVDPITLARSMGASDQDIEILKKMMGLDNNGPGDTIKSDRPPEEAKPEPVPRESVSDSGIHSRAAIVTPEQLGVTNLGQENSGPIPADVRPPNAA